MSRMRTDQGGFMLIELLIASVLSIVVLGASLTIFNGFQRTNQTNQAQNESQDRVRTAVDLLSKQLRNISSPSIEQPTAIDRAGPYDFAFQTSDVYDPYSGVGTNLRRVRYCLDSSTPANEKIWTMTVPYVAGTPMPATTACPGTGWNSARILAGNVTNQSGGQDRFAFAYNATDLKQITLVRTQLFIDADPGRAPAETKLASGVFLRNQNQEPTADADVTPLGGGRVLVNGSGSFDPEGARLDYTWYDGATKMTCAGVVGSCQTVAGTTTGTIGCAAPARAKAIVLTISDGASPAVSLTTQVCVT